MRETDYLCWLESQPLKAKSISTLLSDARRVEREHGVDFDDEFVRDRLKSVRERLAYTADDERQNRGNNSGLSIPRGNLRRTLSPYKSAVARYAAFRDAGG